MQPNSIDGSGLERTLTGAFQIVTTVRIPLPKPQNRRRRGLLDRAPGLCCPTAPCSYLVQPIRKSFSLFYCILSRNKQKKIIIIQLFQLLQWVVTLHLDFLVLQNSSLLSLCSEPALFWPVHHDSDLCQ